MFRRALTVSRPANLAGQWRAARLFAKDSKSSPAPSAAAPTATTAPSTVARIESRLPRFLRHIITPLRNAPLSHITAFVILHEITAILPIFGLAAAFHYFNWLPPYISEGKYVSEGIERFGKWMRKRGWIGENRTGRWWGRGETGTRVVVELATAYAITKALLPLRLVLSVWATPWFATWTVLPITSRLSRVFKRKPVVLPPKTSGAVGTGATGGGALPKDSK